MIVWCAQELPSSCVAACVRMVFGAFGLQLTETQVRHIIGHARLGVSLSQALMRLVDAGALAQLHDDWSRDDLRDSSRTNQHPIVGVERHPLGYPRAFHALVVVDVTSEAVIALDPLDGPEPRRYASRDHTLKAWDIHTGKCIATFYTDEPLYCCAIREEVIIAGGARGVYFLQLVS